MGQSVCAGMPFPYAYMHLLNSPMKIRANWLVVDLRMLLIKFRIRIRYGRRIR